MRILFLDCDSTLSSIEGIDELARLRGGEIFNAVEHMTREAMDGGVPIGEIFSRRLALIRPTAEELAAIARLYMANVEPEAASSIAAARALGWTPIVLSGGFRQAIFPLASQLGISRVEAVDIFFNPDGSYHDFDRKCPTAHAQGKNRVITAIKAESKAVKVVMVGDGASDLETVPDVDLFVGFGRYAVREKVKAGAGAYIMHLGELPALLQGL